LLFEYPAGPGISSPLDTATMIIRARQTVYIWITELIAGMKESLCSDSNQGLNNKAKLRNKNING
jgi:hypothetical protein